MAMGKIQKHYYFWLCILAIAQNGILIRAELIVMRSAVTDVFEGLECSQNRYNINYKIGCICYQSMDTFYVRAGVESNCYKFAETNFKTGLSDIKNRMILNETDDSINTSHNITEIAVWNYGKTVSTGKWMKYEVENTKYWKVHGNQIKLNTRTSWDGLLVAFDNKFERSSTVVVKFTGTRKYPLPNNIEEILQTGTPKNTKENSNTGIIIGIVILLLVQRSYSKDVLYGISCTGAAENTSSSGPSCWCNGTRNIFASMDGSFCNSPKQLQTVLKATSVQIMRKKENELKIDCKKIGTLSIWNYSVTERKASWKEYYSNETDFMLFLSVRRNQIIITNRKSWDGTLVLFTYQCVNSSQSDSILVKFTGKRKYPLSSTLNSILAANVDDNEKSNILVLICVSISIILVILVTIVIVLFLIKRRKAEGRKSVPEEENKEAYESLTHPINVEETYMEPNTTETSPDQHKLPSSYFAMKEPVKNKINTERSSTWKNFLQGNGSYKNTLATAIMARQNRLKNHQSGTDYTDNSENNEHKNPDLTEECHYQNIGKNLYESPHLIKGTPSKDESVRYKKPKSSMSSNEDSVHYKSPKNESVHYKNVNVSLGMKWPLKNINWGSNRQNKQNTKDRIKELYHDNEDDGGFIAPGETEDKKDDSSCNNQNSEPHDTNEDSIYENMEEDRYVNVRSLSS